MTRLHDKTILITGASSGFGEEMARQAAAKGARIGLLARRGDKLEALSAELTALGARNAWRTADVRDADGLHTALDELASELGGVDIVVANAGIGHPTPAHRTPIEEVLGIYQTNLNGALHTIHWAIPKMLEQKHGHIVGIASLASFLGLPATSSYCGAKAALRLHLQSLRQDLKPKNIQVTTICPGFVRTPLTDGNKHPMPFMWDCDRAVRRMIGAIEANRGQDSFPFPLVAALWLGQLLPASLTERFLGGFRA